MNDIQQWAQAVLEMPNLIIAVIDTTSIKKDADIIQLMTLNKHGFFEDFFLIRSGRDQGSNVEWTGLEPEDLAHSDTLPDCWEAVRKAFTGKFVLAYGLDFLQERLDKNARHYGLEEFCIIGECLMQKAPCYFRQTFPAMKLVDACARIGHTMPDHPIAEERARGQLALLKAMAEGRTSAPTPAQSNDEDDLGDLDDAIF